MKKIILLFLAFICSGQLLFCAVVSEYYTGETFGQQKLLIVAQELMKGNRFSSFDAAYQVAGTYLPTIERIFPVVNLAFHDDNTVKISVVAFDELEEFDLPYEIRDLDIYVTENSSKVVRLGTFSRDKKTLFLSHAWLADNFDYEVDVILELR